METPSSVERMEHSTAKPRAHKHGGWASRKNYITRCMEHSALSLSALRALYSALFVFSQSILTCRLNTLGALYQAVWTHWEHSAKLFEHAGSTLTCRLNTLGALYQAVWTHWEHSTKLFEHAGSTLPSCLNTLGALYQAVWTRWEHSLVHAEPRKEHFPWGGQS